MGNSGSTLDAPYSAIGGCTATSIAAEATTFVVASAKSPFPTGASCGVHGQLNPNKASRAAFSTITAAGCANTNTPVFFAPNDPLEHCRNQCAIHNQPDCKSFEYDASTDTCVLYSRTLKTLGLQKPNKPANKKKVFYANACFATTTTSSTPTATSYEWCSATPSLTVTLTDPKISYPGACLANDVADQNTGEDKHVDNLSWEMDMPFDLQYHGQGASSVLMSTAGGISIGGSFGYDLRNVELPTDNLAPRSLAPLWQPQQVNNGTDQALTYSIEGPEGSRVITWSWKTRSQDGEYDYSGNGAERYSYNIVYEEAKPGVWNFNYETVSDSGILATVGAQEMQGYPFDPDGTDFTAQYSFEQPLLSDGLSLVLDTTVDQPVWTEAGGSSTTKGRRMIRRLDRTR